MASSSSRSAAQPDPFRIYSDAGHSSAAARASRVGGKSTACCGRRSSRSRLSGNRHRLADDGLDDFIELRRMRGGHHHPGAVAAFRRAQAAVDFRCGRGVRAPFPSIVHEVLSDTSANCSVIDAVRAQLFADLAPRRIQRAHALHVAGVPDVHGRSQRRDAGTRLPDSGCQEIGHGAIDVVRQDDARDGKPERPRPHRGEGIAEIAGRNDVGRPWRRCGARSRGSMPRSRPFAAATGRY